MGHGVHTSHLKLELRDLGHPCMYVSDIVSVRFWFGSGFGGKQSWRTWNYNITATSMYVCTYTDTGKISDWNEIKLTRGINIIPKEGISGLNHGEFGTTLWGQGEEAHTRMDLAPRDMGMQCTQANYRGTAGEGGERNWVFYCQNVFGNIKNSVTTWVTQHPPQHEIRRCSFAMISTANKVWNWGKVFSILNIGWPWVAALSLLTDSSLHIHTSMHIAS